LTGGGRTTGLSVTSWMAVLVDSTGIWMFTSGGGTSTGGRSSSGGGGGGGWSSFLISSTMSAEIGGATSSIARRARPEASAEMTNTCRAMMAASTAPRRVRNVESCT